jgi:2-octaprenyl-6-methoxyphenol hydroxylase
MHDLIISGAGLSGGILAIALAKHNFHLTILEASEINTSKDQRVSAISYGNSLFLEDLGLWQELEVYAEPILDIRVAENASHSFVHFDHEMVSDAPMGYMIENIRLKNVIYGRLSKLVQQADIKLLAPCSYEKIDIGLYRAHLGLFSGEEIQAPLLISCEGAKSCLRELMQIKTISCPYHQQCIICNINHRDHHQGVAVEKFFPSGPLAVLPMQHGYRSAIVLTEPEFLAPVIMQMEEGEFVTYLQQKIGDYLGDISLANSRQCYPISLIYAKEYYKNRFLLIGDAAHSIHPVAGQGLNLTIRDIKALLQVLVEARGLGLDLGSREVLRKFSKECKPSDIAMMMMTDTLIRLFGNDFTMAKILRKTGLRFVDSIPSIKKFIMTRAAN